MYVCLHICKVVAHPVGGIVPTRRVWQVLAWLTERDHYTDTHYTRDNKRPPQNVKIYQTSKWHRFHKSWGSVPLACWMRCTWSAGMWSISCCTKCWKRRRKRLMVEKCALHRTAAAPCPECVPLSQIDYKKWEGAISFRRSTPTKGSKGKGEKAVASAGKVSPMANPTPTAPSPGKIPKTNNGWDAGL